MMEWLLKNLLPAGADRAMCNAASKGIDAINKYKPDGCVPGYRNAAMNGFDMLEQLTSELRCCFCTAYDQFGHHKLLV